MGNKPQQGVITPPTIQETIFSLKMARLTFRRNYKKAEHDQKQYIKKAKQCLKKNRQEEAKMYVVSAANKSKQALNYGKMAIKMELLCDTVKSTEANKTMMESYNKVTYILQNNTPDIEVMAKDLEKFNQVVDQALINAKVIQQITNKDTGTNQIMVEQMLDKLKHEIALDIKQPLYPVFNKEPDLVDQDFLAKLNALI